jgi:hypothetical protein
MPILAAMLRAPEPHIDIVIENLGGSNAFFYSHINREKTGMMKDRPQDI